MFARGLGAVAGARGPAAPKKRSPEGLTQINARLRETRHRAAVNKAARWAMFSEAGFRTGLCFAAPRARRCRSDRPFETLAAMAGVNIHRIDPDVLRNAVRKCAGCACRQACRRWLRTGVFPYSGDPRCPNADLLITD